jgi:hypothetical protein
MSSDVASLTIRFRPEQSKTLWELNAYIIENVPKKVVKKRTKGVDQKQVWVRPLLTPTLRRRHRRRRPAVRS